MRLVRLLTELEEYIYSLNLQEADTQEIDTYFHNLYGMLEEGAEDDL